MNAGLYRSAEGLIARSHQLDVLSNNLANVNTVGFKPDEVVLRERPIARVERGSTAHPHELLERLGGGLRVDPTITNFEQGSIEPGKGPLDVAILGDGFLRFADAEDGTFRLSRDGRLLRDAGGTLVSATNGLPVLDETGEPIFVPEEGAISIGDDGTIAVDGFAIARLALVDVEDRDALRKTGGGLFETTDEPFAIDGSFRQYALEASGTEPVTQMARLVQLQRAIEQNSRLIQYQDAMNGQAATVLGRPA